MQNQHIVTHTFFPSAVCLWNALSVDVCQLPPDIFEAQLYINHTDLDACRLVFIHCNALFLSALFVLQLLFSITASTWCTWSGVDLSPWCDIARPPSWHLHGRRRFFHDYHEKSCPRIDFVHVLHPCSATVVTSPGSGCVHLALLLALAIAPYRAVVKAHVRFRFFLQPIFRHSWHTPGLPAGRSQPLGIGLYVKQLQRGLGGQQLIGSWTSSKYCYSFIIFRLQSL